MAPLRATFCAFTSSPTELLKLVKADSLICFDPPEEYVPLDLEEYSTWVEVGFLESWLIRIPPPLCDQTVSAHSVLRLELLPAATSFARVDGSCSHPFETYKLTASQLAEALQQVACHSIRVKVSWHHASSLAFLELAHHTDIIWAFEVDVVTRGITLLRGASNSAAQVLPSLGSLGGGHGLVDIPLAARREGVCRVRITQALIRTFADWEGGAESIWLQTDSRELVIAALHKAAGWMEWVETGLSCDLFGASVELSVRAATAERAEQALSDSGMLNWNHLIQGRPTGVPLEVLTVSRAAYVEHLDHIITAAQTHLADALQLHRAEATWIALRIIQEMGLVDHYDFPPGTPAFEAMRTSY
ncbi:uncharacterized protein PFL1_01488 [Pseudozyma flocculosa PF-1]|uniref:Uncharacterized protein n=1 Tax=Pseudozyma flocculosa TaxID=84751 RepID=A0A5C3FCA0_9BASI|nr:uncharacterized protein PFL1_01488 [Pseudozyma flocculosa PF-1]EPQ31303.1 hypothetical protein PFL1_01488 [Pseudozyma flocculosa PF-1]SPO41766.1 uncharacterized protein PSFLO_07248 [Pseudozyma flocculosa]